MEIGDHRADVARRILVPEVSTAQPINVGAVADRKIIPVGFVDRVILSLLWHPHIWVTEHEGTDCGIESKTVNAVSHAVNQDGRRSVDDVPGGDLLASWLQQPALVVI